MNAPRRLRPASDVAAADLEGETVLLDIGSGVYFGLDELGTRIWQLLGEGADEGAIIEQLLDEYDVAPAQLRSDLITFLAALEAKRLVQVVEA